MKITKRILAFLLCLALALSMSLTAFAKSSDDDDDDGEDYAVSDVFFDVSDSQILVGWSVGSSKCSYSVQLYDSSEFKSKNKVGSASTVGYTAEKCDVTEKILNNGSGTYYAVVTCKKKPKGGSYDEAYAKETIYSEDLSQIRQNRKTDTTNTGSTSGGNAAGPGLSSVTAHWNDLGNGKWSYVKEDGTTATGWYNVDGKWYCSGADGVMLAGTWIRSESENGVWYYVGSDGAMFTDTTTPDGYTVDADGKYRE